MKKNLTIMRGLPGSGKSTLARALANVPGITPAPIFSTDDFFMSGGIYIFDGQLLGKHHAANITRTANAMEGNVPHIIVDNTNSTAWEARGYVRGAKRHGYAVQFVEPHTEWAKNPEECARRNTHGVPLQAIQKMLARWEDNLTVEMCLAAITPWEEREENKKIVIGLESK